MVRPKKEASDLQTEKVVVYVTPETKQGIKSAATHLRSSESKIGDQAIQLWLRTNGGESMEYTYNRDFGDLTGPLGNAELVFSKPVDIPFQCSLKGESWSGKVTSVLIHGSHMEYRMVSRGSGLTVIAGRSLSGWFVALPGEQVCLDLADPNDVFYNQEQAFTSSLNRIDAVSVIQSFRAVYRAGFFGERD
ncbi:hypothetical protein LLE49_25925 [Alicyclobacillus tolerans]|uniref:hypothetical protein n=1 Tax=Alicyclobacillus tolerans TaxID=90970 RepID=UPI001F2CD615|nr:hypothetical protein [Alicyclobacillus tolerans]MCF8568168.1 hypothetical protein [Alicyclobacillus tolerans]